MVQIIPRTPTFGESIMPQIQNAVGAFAKQRSDANDQSIINSFNPNDSAINQIQKFAKLSPDRQNAMSPLFNQLIKSQEKQGIASSKLAADQQKEEQETAGLKSTLDFLDENYKYAGTNVIPGFKSFTAGGLNRDAVQKREEIDRSGFLAADAIFTKYNKGTVSKDKLKLVQDMAPKSTDSERVYKAKVSALRRMAKLPQDISQGEFDKQFSREAKAVEKATPKEAETQSSIKEGQTATGPNGQKIVFKGGQWQSV